MVQNPIEINVAGHRVVLKSSHSDPELIKEVVELVSEKLKTAQGRSNKSTAAHQVVLLALMDLAEEHISAKRRTADFQRKIGEKTARLHRIFEANLK